MMDEHETHMALRARLEAIAELPEQRSWEQVGTRPVVNEPHIVEQFVPGSVNMISGPAQGGSIQTDGDYVVMVYGLTAAGDEAIREITAAIRAAFAPGVGETLPSGNVLRIKTKPAPWAGQILPAGNNKSRCTVTIPFYVHSINTIPST
jgi:hypothetical protein